MNNLEGGKKTKWTICLMIYCLVSYLICLDAIKLKEKKNQIEIRP